jgi:hypothetical protein
MNSSLRNFVRVFRLLSLIPLLFALPAAADEAHASHSSVKVILWFDTEDYMLPADDDAAKRIADMLTERHIRGTFKVVGEKARVLEKRGRHDVIESLSHHDIGYHSNFHSRHPAPTEYLNYYGLLDGIDEFVRREARGAADVRRIFNVPTLSCYGQPGASWAAQAVAGLSRCGISNGGIPCYLDSGNQVGIGGRPFWYCGVLNVYDMRGHETRMNLWDETEPQTADKTFDMMVARLAAEGGGLISIWYHPCEFVHVEFWDKVNFSRGANPPREQWKAERQRPASDTDAAFARYGKYLDHMAATPGVKFITASELPAVYPDRLRTEGATPEEMLELARRVSAADSKGITYQILGNKAFSPADQFALLCTALDRQIAKELPGPQEVPARREGAAVEPGETLQLAGPLLGPDGEPPAEGAVAGPLNWFAFRDATRDACDSVKTQHRVPARVFIGPDAVPPADFLYAIAATYLHFHEAHKFPETVPLGSGVKLLTADNVVKDSPAVFGGWIIHRAGFQAPKVLDVARLQAWTLKPAIPQ